MEAEFLNVLTLDVVQQFRQAWLNKMGEYQTRLHQVHEHATQLQKEAEQIRDEMKTLDGAVQAADAFLKVAESQPPKATVEG